MHLRKSKKKKGFGVKATVVAKEMAEYTAKYNAWRIRMFTEYIKQNADPRIEGEITDEKFKDAGIKIINDGAKSWLEQKGKVISRVLEAKPFDFDFKPHANN